MLIAGGITGTYPRFPAMTSLRPGRAPRILPLAVATALVFASASCGDPRPGSPVCRRGTPRITVYQGPDGSCIERSDIVGYRCENADPLVVFDSGSGTERRFLGGAFAVSVATLPERAQVVGVGDGAQLVTVPGQDQWLYSVRGPVMWRWLALPPSPQLAGDDPSALMIGDSLLEGAAPALVAALPEWSLRIDAVPGRTSSSGPALADARGQGDHAVVVELGTNDRVAAAFVANAQRTVATLRDAPLVLWQNVQGPPDVVPAEEINAALESLAARRPNVAIADWDETVPDEYLHDGVHPDQAHLGAMATLIAPLLERWRDAATAQPSCDR